MTTRGVAFPVCSWLVKRGWLPDLASKKSSWPGHPCRVLMAEIVDHYTDLSFQDILYEVEFDPVKVSPDGSFYDFGPQGGRASGWRQLKRRHGDFGFYVASVLEEQEDKFA